MDAIRRDELTDYQTYADNRDQTRPVAMAAKALRRVRVGEYLTFLFENRDTIRYQVQEMMRVERIVREADILHELSTYNELLGADGKLCATLLVEIDDPAARDDKLQSWLSLNETLYGELPDGTKVRPTYDPRQVGETRLSSVQYLTFDFGGAAPVAIGCEHPDIATETVLTDAVRAALQSDLDE